MSRRRYDPRRAKMHFSYTIAEVAELYDVHRNTVKAWLKSGLTTVDNRRPVLIRGEALRSHLEAWRAASKCPCQPGRLYCFKCRAPRPPALGMADFIPHEARAGNLVALCATCGRTMCRRVRAAAIGAILPGIDVRIVQATPHLTECPTARLNGALRRN